MNDDQITLLKRRLQREKTIRQQAEAIAEKKSRELYLKSEELKNALKAEEQVRKKVENLYKEVKRLSLIDPLTELSNRRSFFADAHKILRLAIRHQKDLSCAMMDIDFFKKINDTYGHDFGDKVLILVTKECKKGIRETDLLARFGGEEFCFLFPETDLRDAILTTERIRCALSKLVFNTEKNSFSVTASFGVSKLLDSNDNIKNLIKRSDGCLYKAKATGRNRVVFN